MSGPYDRFQSTDVEAITILKKSRQVKRLPALSDRSKRDAVSQKKHLGRATDPVTTTFGRDVDPHLEW